MNPHQKSAQYEVMKNKRKADKEIIENFLEKTSTFDLGTSHNSSNDKTTLPETDANDIKSTFSKVIVPKKRESSDSLYKKSKKLKKQNRDMEHYIPYQSSDKHTEDGMAINNFERQARAAELSVTSAGDQEIKFRPGQKKWDRLRKKMVAVENPRNGKIRTESGIWIPATYKTGRYAEWKEKTKIEEQVQNEFGDEATGKFIKIRQTNFEGCGNNFGTFSSLTVKSHAEKYPVARWKRNMLKQDGKKGSTGKESELRRPEQIAKERFRLELIRNREKTNKKIKDSNRKRTAKNQKKRRK